LTKYAPKQFADTKVEGIPASSVALLIFLFFSRKASNGGKGVTLSSSTPKSDGKNL
jgi:hypothetical protein